ncbi:MAG TPA: alpha/beta hydrolase [Acidimicrobiaceae bacterium]|nr:alpha/beta hydrolase [Acidimicrobiaceae bacterium]
MANFVRDGVDLHYDVHGSGFPLLLIAPGGMRSAAEAWESTPWNPATELSDRYRVITMDQRNAGESSAPVAGDDTWDTYTGDQLALLDHLGVDRFHVAGMCIGGPYIMGLIKAAPERVVSGTIIQPIGLDDNRGAFYGMFNEWADDLRPERPDTSDAEWTSFRSNMYDGEFLFNVDPDFVAGVRTPLLVLMGDDLFHPQSISRAIASLAPNAELIESWSDGADRTAAMARCAEFLDEHTP